MKIKLAVMSSLIAISSLSASWDIGGVVFKDKPVQDKYLSVSNGGEIPDDQVLKDGIGVKVVAFEEELTPNVKDMNEALSSLSEGETLAEIDSNLIMNQNTSSIIYPKSMSEEEIMKYTLSYTSTYHVFLQYENHYGGGYYACSFKLKLNLPEEVYNNIDINNVKMIVKVKGNTLEFSKYKKDFTLTRTKITGAQLVKLNGKVIYDRANGINDFISELKKVGFETGSGYKGINLAGMDYMGTFKNIDSIEIKGISGFYL